jgi:pimeloyl-ACP methyl ester carboxylesterase
MRRPLLLALVLFAACESGPVTPYVPRDASLRDQPLFFYPARTKPARAFVFFLGNDVGFWKPHEELAWRLAGIGYDVVGLDLKKYLGELPQDEPARDSSFAASVGALIARTRTELGADSLPAVVGGHSFGAEVAFWIALHRPPPNLVGVLAMSPRSTGHLVVTPADLLNHEASGPWSFSTVRAAADIAPGVRIALVRGASDQFRRHDSAFMAAGGGRLRYFLIPFANHSLRKLLIAGPIVEHALEFLVEPRGGEKAGTAVSLRV